MKKCSKSNCNQGGYIKIGYSFYCDKHYRFIHMKDGARKHKKYIPSYNELETLFNTLIDMKCPICKVQMLWRTQYGKRSDVMSLQHYNNGMLDLICCKCNAIHGNHILGDQLIELSCYERHCSSCHKIKNQDEFCKNRNHDNGFSNTCKKCKRTQTNNFRTQLKESNKCVQCHKQIDREGTRCLKCCEKRKYKRRTNNAT